MKNKAAQKLGKLGGQATAKKLGSKHFSEAGKKGMANRWTKPTPTPPTETVSDRLIDILNTENSNFEKRNAILALFSPSNPPPSPTVEKWERELDRMVYPLGGGEMKPVETSPGVLQFKKPPIPKNYPIKDLFRHSLQQAREERDREWRERIEGMKKSRPPVKVRLTSEISDWLNDGYQLALSDLLTKDKK